ncbi:Tetratricopeptide repeat (TPR)-like superfamily protein, putative [Theobroma cacao]|uniref:Tetratricopeptide repeat (TPR)-like superfamily protein, putative n=1 Tax=Theobroma cacao TaxID=3641 RepID=A0A061EEG8_THECC|nr:Tetratricopeptide repeat (TPR)-like superfamily protein, putative [Theobroma cacao]
MKRRQLLVNLFKACNDGKSAAKLHSLLLKTGFSDDSFFTTKLTSIYAKFTSIEEAQKLFDEMPRRTVYLWNSILRAYSKQKQWNKAWVLFKNMISNEKGDKNEPDNFTLSIVLKACAGLQLLQQGEILHGFLRQNEKVGLDLFVGSALIEFYSKCGQMGDALKVFEEFEKPDVVLCTSMVSGYEQNGCFEKAVAFFSRMVTEESVEPDRVTLVSLVSACAKLMNLKLGRSVHGFVIRRGFEKNLSLVNALLHLYAKTGVVEVAENLFRRMVGKDVVSWSSMIGCYSHNGAAVEALRVFNEMINQGFQPNTVTVVSALQACAVACDLDNGQKIHELATKRGFDLEVSVSTALIDMYMKCLSPNEAVNVFRKMPRKDVVSWAALLSGYAQTGMADKSIRVFRDMLSSGILPDAVSMVKILASSSELGILHQAVCLHGYITRSGFDSNPFVGASLIELYSKCGSLDYAIKVFKGIIDKDVVLWSAMIAGYGIHGKGRESLKLFELMVKSSAARPNNVTFLSILSACSHAGLVLEGIEIFSMMVNDYGLGPTSEHYGIVVDLLGRTGELDRAMDIINRMPVPVEPHVWGTLLAACRIHHNVEIGELAAKNLLCLDSNHAGYYILLSNIYAVDGKWGNVAKIRTLIKEKELKKMFAQSMVEIRNEVHSFVADDKFHPECERIYELLGKLDLTMRLQLENIYGISEALLNFKIT